VRLNVIAAFALLAACAGETVDGAQAGRYDRLQLEQSLAESDAGVVIGTFALANHPVVDGDTIKVVGLDASLRLLGLDCEETFKSDKALRKYEQGFDEYLRSEQGDSPKPVKIPTPLGMDAKKFAEEFFADVSEVRLERDHPKDIRDRYNRYLGYVLAKKGGKWVNYNVECVRAGMSPYFTKYGYANRYHAEFVKAQQQARHAKVGIWDPAKEHYRDYDLRLRWWDARAEFVAEFERDAKGKSDFIALTHWDAMDQLAQNEGKEVELLATVGDIRIGRGGAPTRVMLARRMFADFPLVFFDDEVFERSGIAEASGEYVRARGTVTKYKFKGKRGRPGGEQLQIVVKRPEQIRFVDTLGNALKAVAPAPEPEPVTPQPEPLPVEPEPEPSPPAATPSEPPPPPADASSPAPPAG